MGNFYFNGVSAADLGLVVERFPNQNAPKRKITSVAIPGRNGELHFDDGCFDNYAQRYQCWFKRAPVANAAHIIKQWLLSAPAGARLEDTYDDAVYRLATFRGPMDIENVLNRFGRCVIEFDCAPQSFLKTGEIPVSFAGMNQTVELHNPTAFAAKPVITVHNAAMAEATCLLSVNGVAVHIHSLTDQITLDCELMDAYRQVGDGAPESWNNKIYAPVFPVLAPGINRITWDGGIGAVEIIPRWWTL